MNFSEPFIRRPVMTTVLTVSIVLFGILSYFRLPVNDLPAVDYPVIQVQVDYPGASPDTVANAIATPLERQFMQINGLELVTSKSSQGHASMTLQFALNKSIDAWDDRLELRRATLERQYTALEKALSQLSSQSSWLTSQLDALSSSTQ